MAWCRELVGGSAGGLCVPGSPASCSDQIYCTDDVCGLTTGCSNVNNIKSCSDDDACTQEDVCNNGICEGSAFTCDDKRV